MELFDGTENLQIRFHIFLLTNTNLRNIFMITKTAYEREMCVCSLRMETNLYLYVRKRTECLLIFERISYGTMHSV